MKLIEGDANTAIQSPSVRKKTKKKGVDGAELASCNALAMSLIMPAKRA